VYKIVLEGSEKENREKLLNNIEQAYMLAKEQNKTINFFLNVGKLPSPDSDGWTEKYWATTLAQMRHKWEKR